MGIAQFRRLLGALALVIAFAASAWAGCESTAESLAVKIARDEILNTQAELKSSNGVPSPTQMGTEAERLKREVLKSARLSISINKRLNFADTLILGFSKPLNALAKQDFRPQSEARGTSKSLDHALPDSTGPPEFSAQEQDLNHVAEDLQGRMNLGWVRLHQGLTKKPSAAIAGYPLLKRDYLTARLAVWQKLLDVREKVCKP